MKFWFIPSVCPSICLSVRLPIYLSIFVVLGIRSRASGMLSKCCITTLHPQDLTKLPRQALNSPCNPSCIHNIWDLWPQSPDFGLCHKTWLQRNVLRLQLMTTLGQDMGILWAQGLSSGFWCSHIYFSSCSDPVPRSGWAPSTAGQSKPTTCFCKKFLLDHSDLFAMVLRFYKSWVWQRLSNPQNLRYFLFGPLQEKLADSCSRKAVDSSFLCFAMKRGTVEVLLRGATVLHTWTELSAGEMCVVTEIPWETRKEKSHWLS